VFVWKQNYILVDEYFFFCCTWIVNSAHITALYAWTDKAFTRQRMPDATLARLIGPTNGPES
ncbi:hypothetical protein, partial [Escherichia coli]|uniref:hypothetical protein n=1 Tax=Escherichia coli TaxID=562 RepID=UPI001BC84699